MVGIQLLRGLQTFTNILDLLDPKKRPTKPSKIIHVLTKMSWQKSFEEVKGFLRVSSLLLLRPDVVLSLCHMPMAPLFKARELRPEREVWVLEVLEILEIRRSAVGKPAAFCLLFLQRKVQNDKSATKVQNGKKR